MKRTYTLRRNMFGNYIHDTSGMTLCGHSFRDAFDVRNEKIVDIVVQTTKPRGNNYHVIDKPGYLSEPHIVYEATGESEIFEPKVDKELNSFGTYPLYVSVYA